MDGKLWYFVDRARQRQGPVSAAALADAFRAGQADDVSLVWHEGLAQWAPLRGFRDELGLTGESPPPLPAPTHVPPAALPPPKRTSGCLIAVLVAAGLAIPVLSILAAIALPAYQDYIIRSQTTAALHDLRAHVAQVEEFYRNEDRCPRDAAELAIATDVTHAEGRSTRIRVGERPGGRCQITGEIVGGNPLIDRAAIRLTRDEDGDWRCTATIERQKYLPHGCEPEG